MQESKTCANCGNSFNRRHGLSQTQWAFSKFCSRRCAARKATGQGLLERFFQTITFDPITRCWLWTGSQDTSGYGLFSVDGKTYKAHRFIFDAAVERLADDELVLHRCDMRVCVNPFHLFKGTYQDNTDDCILKGRQNVRVGINCSSTKLTEEQVLAIRSDPRTQEQIAADYQIAQTTVSSIKLKKNWKHV